MALPDNGEREDGRRRAHDEGGGDANGKGGGRKPNAAVLPGKRAIIPTFARLGER